jgi:hypothetical protein
MSMLRTKYGPALSLPTTDGHQLEPPNNGNVGWSANEPCTTAFVAKSRSGGAATRHIFRSGSSSTGNHILFTTTGPVPNARHEGAGGAVTISGGSMVNDTTWHTLLTTWRPHFFGLYLDGNLVASSTAANTATSTAWSIFRFGWGFSTNQDFNGDIALIACFAASWTPAMIRRWNADPFGFLRPWTRCLRSWEVRHRPRPPRPAQAWSPSSWDSVEWLCLGKLSRDRPHGAPPAWFGRSRARSDHAPGLPGSGSPHTRRAGPTAFGLVPLEALAPELPVAAYSVPRPLHGIGDSGLRWLLAPSCPSPSQA